MIAFSSSSAVVVKILSQTAAEYGLVRGTRVVVFVEEGGVSCNFALGGCFDVFVRGGMLVLAMLEEAVVAIVVDATKKRGHFQAYPSDICTTSRHIPYDDYSEYNAAADKNLPLHIERNY